MDDYVRSARPRSRWRRRLLSCATVLLGIAVLLAVVATVGYWYLFIRPDGNGVVGEPVHVVVPSGSTNEEIARLLSEAGVVQNANMFRLQARIGGVSHEFKAGEYDLETGMSDEAVMARLRKGPTATYYTLTVPEGFTVDQIGARLAKVSPLSAEEFLRLAKSDGQGFSAEHPWIREVPSQSLEGYLFPKTYRIKKGQTERDVIEMMLDQFEHEVAALDLAYPNKRRMTLHQIVTVASMVEREAKIERERPLVASVIYNRIDENMFLGICATIEYVIPERKFRLNSSDLEIDSPYNTYRRKGLPPGPIACPGLPALQAAVKPATSRYLFYVLTSKDGAHTFCVTYPEFEKAKALSRKVFGE